MNRAILVPACLVLAQAAVAQNADLAIFLDARPTLSFRSEGDATWKWYDASGRASIVGLHIVLDNGNRAYVAQRLQKYPGTGDPDFIDEYYLEDTGRWRVGKQVLPFGTRTMLRETVAAIRFDTHLLFAEAPLAIAYCDAGPGRERGVVGRIGRTLGVSFATGNNFAIQASSLTQFRPPEQSTGKGRGYGSVLGADGTVDVGSFRIEGEWVMLRSGATALDVDTDLSDLRVVVLVPGTDALLTAGWARDWTSNQDFFRLEGQIEVANKVSLVPFVRYDGRRMRNAGFTVRVKL